MNKELISKLNDCKFVKHISEIKRTIKIITNIFVDETESYLCLYLFDDDGLYLTDSNNVRDICYACFDVSVDRLKEGADKCGLNYGEYGVVSKCDDLNFDIAIQKYQNLIKFIKLKEVV